MLFWIRILDGSGGKPKLKESSKTYNFWFLIWFDRHLDNQKFRCETFLLETENPAIQCCLDYWLITNSIQELYGLRIFLLEEVEKVNIISAIRSDQSAIMIHINAIKKHGLWIFWKPFGNLMQVYWKRRKICEQDKRKN